MTHHRIIRATWLGCVLCSCAPLAIASDRLDLSAYLAEINREAQRTVPVTSISPVHPRSRQSDLPARERHKLIQRVRLTRYNAG